MDYRFQDVTEKVLPSCDKHLFGHMASMEFINHGCLRMCPLQQQIKACWFCLKEVPWQPSSSQQECLENVEWLLPEEKVKG